jgi:hypothetical protein
MSELKDENVDLTAEPENETDGSTAVKTSNQKKGKRRRRSGRSMFGPILLIAIGALLLLINLDMLPELNWRALLRLWPLMLIFLGLNVIVRQAGRPVGTFFSAMLALLAVAIFGYVLLFADQMPFVGERLSDTAVEVEQRTVTFPADGVEEAEVFVGFGAPGGHVYALQDSNELMDAEVSYTGELLFESDLTAGVSTIALESSGRSQRSLWSDPLSWFEEDRGDPWQVGLSPRAPMNLDLDLGSGSMDLALEALYLTGLRVDGGSGSSELTLPAGDYDVSYDVGSGSVVMTLPESGSHAIRIDGGSGSLTILVPETAAVRLTSEGGSGGLNLPGGLFVTAGQIDGNEGRWQTDNYDDSEGRIELFIDIGSGSVTFEQA